MLHRLRRDWPLVGIVLLLVAGCADSRRIRFSEETLDNGLHVVYAPLHQAPVVHVRVIYHVGSKDERPDRQGFAHLFEHMMFRGSAHVRPEEHMKLIGSVGGYSNAFTSFDQTVYVNTLPSNQTELALYLEADRMASFKVSPEIFDTERKVVFEEWGRKQNQPYGSIYEDFLKLVFTTHSYRWTPIGDMDHLRNATAGDLQEFFNTYYVPNNATLVVAGDIDTGEARRMVHRYFAWIARGGQVQRLARPEPPQTAERRGEAAQVVPAARMVLGYQVPGIKSDDLYPLQMLSSILGEGAASRLDAALVNNPQPLCRSVSVGDWSLEDHGVMLINAMVLAGRDPQEVETRTRQAIAQVLANGVTEEELSRVKMQARVSEVTQRQTAENLAAQLGSAAVFLGNASRVNTDMARIEAVTVRDIHAVARKYLVDHNSTVFWVKPAAKPPQPATAPVTAPATAPAAPARVSPRAVSFPADYPQKPPISAQTIRPSFQKGTQSLIDGIRVIVMPDSRLPLVTWSVTMRRGSHAQPSGKEGLGALTTALMERGAGELKYLDFSRDLESHGITIDVSDGGDYTRLSGSCLVDQLEHAILRSRQVLRSPRFDADEFARLKEQTLNDLRQKYESPESVASMELAGAIYGDSPLGRRSSPASLGAITLADIRGYYERICQPTDAIVVVAGDVSVARGQELAARLIGDWKGASLPAVGYDFPPAAAARRIVVVDRPEGKQSLIRMAVRAYGLASDDKFAGSVMDRILSHGISSRLGRYVRAEKGYAYSVWGMFQPGRQAGQFTAGTETSFATTADALEAMFKVFSCIGAVNVTDEELSETKLRMAGAMVMGMQTVQQQAGYRVDGILNGYPIDYYDTYPARIGQVTADEVRQVAQRWLRDDRMTIVVVAPASAVAEPLKRLGDVQVVPMPSRRGPASKP